MSGKKVVLLGDLGTDHEGFPPTPVINGSPDVFIDGKPVARVGDQLAPHSKPKHSAHPRTIASGSSTVFINGSSSPPNGPYDYTIGHFIICSVYFICPVGTTLSNV